MSRYIDVDKINPMRCPQSIEEMRKWIDEQPTADVVEVVRCRDCRYRARRGGIFGHYACTILGGRYVRELPVDDRFFCYYGERKVQE